MGSFQPFQESAVLGQRRTPPPPQKDKIQGLHALSRYLKDFYQKYQNELMAN